MCLQTTQKEPKVARKSISCFKVVKTYRKDEKLYTPFRDYQIFLGRTFESDLGTPVPMPPDEFYVEVGIHTFKHLKDALRVRDLLEIGSIWAHYRIVKARIPWGSSYYEGDFEAEGESYASNKVYYDKEIKSLWIYRRLYRMFPFLK